VLGQDGYEVRATSTGQEGIQALREYSPDLALIDVGLPDMDGYDVVRAVRPQLSGKIVMLSARSAPDDMAIGLAAGADAYLTKPFRPRALRERLAEILQGASE
jgi:DNA-binding response OmpR family regulator